MAEAEPMIELYCPGCGYDQRGIESDKCPECGLAIDRSRLGESIIPWTHRKRIGRVDAFFKTVRAATFHPGSLAKDCARPVSYGDAERFRWIAVIVTALPLIIPAMVIEEIFWHDLRRLVDARLGPQGQSSGPIAWWVDLVACWVTGMLMPPVIALGTVAWVALCSGVASYLFHPSSLSPTRQNRAIAVSYYAFAPMTLFVLFPLGLWAINVIERFGPPGNAIVEVLSWSVGMSVMIALTLFGGAMPIVSYVGTLRSLMISTHCSFGKLLAAGIGVPLLWVAMAVLSFGLLPLVAGYIILVVRSLWV